MKAAGRHHLGLISAASCLRSNPVLCRRCLGASSALAISEKGAGLAAGRVHEVNLAAEAGRGQEGPAGVEAGSPPEEEVERWQLSEAVAAERAMLHRLECEIRR